MSQACLNSTLTGHFPSSAFSSASNLLSQTLNKHPETTASTGAKPPPPLLLLLQDHSPLCHRAEPRRSVAAGGEQLGEPAGLRPPWPETPREQRTQGLAPWGPGTRRLRAHAAARRCREKPELRTHQSAHH